MKKWIVILSIIPLLTLFTPGLPITHDGVDHVARIANFYGSLSEGVLVPRWAQNLNWGYGHPILMFLYPLPEYMASAFHAVGFNLVDSTKLVFGASYILSALTMYIFLSSFWGKGAAVIGTILYQFAPYRFVDLYVRGAIGEHVAFIFPPLVLYFLHKQKWVGFSLSLAALVLSHNAVAIMFLPVIIGFGLYVFLFNNKKRISIAANWLIFTILGFGLAAFFWMPALLEGKFTLRNIVTQGEALTRFVPFWMFLYSPWNYGGGADITKSVGLVQWIGVVAGCILLLKAKQKKVKILMISLLVFFVISLFLMTEGSSFIWERITILQNFQFPWRFLSLTVFVVAVLGSIAIDKLIPRKIVIGLMIISIAITATMWRPKAYEKMDDSRFTGVYAGTTDTGESSPIWSVRFMEHTPANHLDVGEGDVTIREGFRNSTVHEYTIDVREPSLLVENTLYFPGWMIYVNGLPTGIQWQNPAYRGLMTFRVTPGQNQKVRVVLTDTKVRKAANYLSVVSFMILVGIIIWQQRKRFQ